MESIRRLNCWWRHPHTVVIYENVRIRLTNIQNPCITHMILGHALKKHEFSPQEKKILGNAKNTDTREVLVEGMERLSRKRRAIGKHPHALDNIQHPHIIDKSLGNSKEHFLHPKRIPERAMRKLLERCLLSLKHPKTKYPCWEEERTRWSYFVHLLSFEIYKTNICWPCIGCRPLFPPITICTWYSRSGWPS